MDTLGHARTTFEQGLGDSCRLFEAADRDAPLEPEDLERHAIAAYLTGRDDESEALWGRAHQTFLDRGDPEGAARAAGWLGFGLLHRGARAPASGWFARAERILDEAQLDSVARGYLLIPTAIQQIVQGDPAASCTTFKQAAEIANRFGDRDLASIACHGRGRALIRLGDIRAGLALLDEAMVALISGKCRRWSRAIRTAACSRDVRRSSICAAPTNGRPPLHDGVPSSRASCAIAANVSSIAPR